LVRPNSPLIAAIEVVMEVMVKIAMRIEESKKLIAAVKKKKRKKRRRGWEGRRLYIVWHTTLVQ